MSDVEQIKDGNIILSTSPFSNIGKHDVLNSTVDVPATAFRMCNPPSHIPSTQYAPIGNSMIKSSIPKLSAHEVSDEVSICPVILHPTNQSSSQVQMKSDALIKTIGFPPSRSHMIAQPQSRIVTSSLQLSMESQNVSPLIITPTPLIHTSNDLVSAKIVPIPSSAPVSHFSVINKPGSYDGIPPEYTGTRQSMVSGTPPVYTQSDFARFPPKSYLHKSAVINPAVIHGPISGNNEEPCINILNSQHVFKPIISPRPSILRKRDADGVLRAQKNLLPILTKPDLEDCQNLDETSINRNGFSESGLQIESIMVPQIPEIVLPQISALTRQSHIMIEISPRKKPRKQLLPVNQDSPYKIVGDEMEYVEEKVTKNDRNEEYEDIDCNDDCGDGDLEDEVEDELDDNDMDVDDDCPADDDYDEDDDDFGDGFDYIKSEKTFYKEVKTEHLSDNTSSYTKLKNKRPTLLGNIKNMWRGHTHHFQKYTDFKIKETKKQLAEMQQAKKWMSDSRIGWRVTHLLKQFDGMIKIEEDIIERLNELINMLEANVNDQMLRHTLIELVKDNIQRSKVTRDQLEEIRLQLSKIFEYKTLIEDVVDKYCPKDIKKKCAKVFSKS